MPSKGIGIEDLVHFMGFRGMMAHPDFHLQLDIDPGMIGEEHQVEQRKTPINHAEVHIRMDCIVWILYA